MGVAGTGRVKLKEFLWDEKDDQGDRNRKLKYDEPAACILQVRVQMDLQHGLSGQFGPLGKSLRGLLFQQSGNGCFHLCNPSSFGQFYPPGSPFTKRYSEPANCKSKEIILLNIRQIVCGTGQFRLMKSA